VPTQTLLVTPTATWTPIAVQAATSTPVPTAAQTPTSTPTPVPPPTGGGGQIVLSARIENNWDLYAFDVETGERTRLTADPAEDRFPAMSPDGRSLVFASRRGGVWNLYLRDPAGTIEPLTDDPAYDSAPSWSPDGTQIAFESQRSGDLDVWVMDLSTRRPVNLTPDSPAVDCGPVFSPDGRQVAFTSYRFGDADIFAVDLATGELEQLTSSPDEEQASAWLADGTLLYTVFRGEDQDVYRRPVDLAHDQPGERLTRWRVAESPAMSLDGTAIAFLLRRAQGVQVLLQSVEDRETLPVRLGPTMVAAGPLLWVDGVRDWQPAQGEPVVLYVEQTSPGDDTPYDLKRLEGIDVGNPWLSDRVDDSFWAMRQRVIDETGHDFYAQLSDAWRAVSYCSEGSSYTSWHKAGRAIDTLLDYLSPDHRQRWLELVLEPGGGEIYWRLYLRCSEQDGSQGAPLRVRPWDATAAARSNGQGGRRKAIPSGYYVDLTDLMSQYGWQHIAAHDQPDFHWHQNFVALEYWHFQKTEGLLWWEAMLELFAPEVMEMHHSWPVQETKGTPLWLAWAKGIPIPWEERRMLERIER